MASADTQPRLKHTRKSEHEWITTFFKHSKYDVIEEKTDGHYIVIFLSKESFENGMKRYKDGYLKYFMSSFETAFPLDEFYIPENGFVALLLNENRVTASCLLIHDPTHTNETLLEMFNLFSVRDPKHKIRGQGKKLLKILCDNLKSEKSLWLGVETSNTEEEVVRLTKTYNEAGFQQTSFDYTTPHKTTVFSNIIISFFFRKE
jgi:hypothetical protein